MEDQRFLNRFSFEALAQGQQGVPMPPTTQTIEQMPAKVDEQPELLRSLSLFAVFGCIMLAVSIVIADFVVPDHDWITDTISDLGAGRYEFIVDMGLYAFSAALIGLA
ncbi:hypothetical protein [Marivita sp. XM-24bin2]